VSLESTRRGKRQAGKAFGYLVLLRVPEYLVFDPRGEFLAGRVRAWRRVGDVINRWEPDADGLYHSQLLDIAVRPDEALLRVFDPEGKPVPYWFENARTARAQAQEIAELLVELERLRRQHPGAPR
jgi:hypothetical protein